MTTTDIQFKEKQDFQTIKSVIDKEFENVQTHKKISDLDYISFDYKRQNIYCYFMKHNRIYGKGNFLTECSSFSSDRPNEIKTEAFKRIAKYFDCRFWENDCVENNFIDFKKIKLIMEKDILEELEIKIAEIHVQCRDVTGIIMHPETAKRIFSQISYLPFYDESAFLKYRGIVIYRSFDIDKNEVKVF